MGRRTWELSGGIVRCEVCGHAMVSHTVGVGKKSRPTYFYYACRTRYRKGHDACPKPLNIQAHKLERRIWEAISGILKDPVKLRDDLNAMIEIERAGKRGNPHEEAKLWADRLEEAERMRGRYQEMAAADLITFDELRAKLAELDQMRRTAECELNALNDHQEHIHELEQDRDTLLDSLTEVAPDALESLTPEERHQVYKMLRLKVIANRDGSLEASGAFADDLSFCQSETERPRL
jgi:Recombinase zinc beta ribbon domain